jgi:hypothetical protein
MPLCRFIAPVIGATSSVHVVVAALSWPSTRPDIQMLDLCGSRADTRLRHGVLEQKLDFLPRPLSPVATLARWSQ